YPVPGAQVSSDYLRMVYTVSLAPNPPHEHHMDTFVDPELSTLKAVSDLQGRFSFFNVYPNGFLPLSVTCAGYRTLEKSVPLEKGEHPLTLVLDPGAAYGGKVLAQGGQPVPGACVVLLAAPTCRVSGALMTDQAGKFRAVDQHGGAKFAAVFAPGF